APALRWLLRPRRLAGNPEPARTLGRRHSPLADGAGPRHRVAAGTGHASRTALLPGRLCHRCRHLSPDDDPGRAVAAVPGPEAAPAGIVGPGVWRGDVPDLAGAAARTAGPNHLPLWKGACHEGATRPLERRAVAGRGAGILSVAAAGESDSPGRSDRDAA